MNKYTFIFEIIWRDPKTGQFKTSGYRKRNEISIADARSYARRLVNIQNVLSVRFYKEMC